MAAALPPNPYELEATRKMTAVRLELEAARLRQRLANRDRLAAELADTAANPDHSATPRRDFAGHSTTE